VSAGCVSGVRYITSDPIGLRGGLNTYGYVGGNPLNYIDSLGLSRAGTAGGRPGLPASGGTGGIDWSQPWLPPSVNDAINNAANTLACLRWGVCNENAGGSASGPAPHSHSEERDARGVSPDPFGDNCDQMKWAIDVLRAQIAWRQTDLNPASGSYIAHRAHIRLLEAQLERLESAYNSICGDNCAQ